MPPYEINPLRGEVWWVDLDPSVGAELQKRRPCVIMNVANAGRLPLRVLVPLTGWQEAFDGYPWCVQILPDTENQLQKISAADTFQIKSLSLDRFSRKLGVLSPAVVDEIAFTIAYVVGYVAGGAPADGTGQ